MAKSVYWWLTIYLCFATFLSILRVAMKIHFSQFFQLLECRPENKRREQFTRHMEERAAGGVSIKADREAK